MNDAALMLLYAAAKLVAYGLWCAVGLKLLSRATNVSASVRFGAIRWVIGLFVGIFLFFAIGSIDADAAARTYALVYTPVRALEWGIMAFLIARGVDRASPTKLIVRLSIWCAGGILVSFLTDLLSPEGLQGRFCVGRCLC